MRRRFVPQGTGGHVVINTAVPVPHRCKPPTSSVLPPGVPPSAEAVGMPQHPIFGRGSVWRCDACGRYWTVREIGGLLHERLVWRPAGPFVWLRAARVERRRNRR